MNYHKSFLFNIILASTLATFSTSSSLNPNNFQTNLQTCIIHNNPLSEPFQSQEKVVYSLTLKQPYESLPLALVSPLAITGGYQKNQNITLPYFFVKTQIKNISQTRIYFQIFTSGRLAAVKISSLIISTQMANNQRLFLFTLEHPIEAEQSNSLRKESGEQIRVVQRMQSSNEVQPYHQNAKVIKNPFDSFNFFTHIFASQIRVLLDGLTNFNLEVWKTQDAIQIIYWPPAEKEGRFIGYSLLLQAEKIFQTQIIFSTFDLVQTKSLFSEKTKKNSIFIGIRRLSGVYSPQLAHFTMAVNRSTHFYTFQDSLASDIHEIAYSLLQVQEHTQTQNYPDFIMRRILLTCPLPTFITTYQNHWTTWTDPTNTNTQTCQPCPTGCYNCTYCSNCLRFVNCTLCRPGFSFVTLGVGQYPSNQMVCRCPTGTYPNATTNTCQNCTSVIPNCGSCKAYQSGHYSATCANCTKGFFAVANSGSWGGFTVCQVCTAGCAACTTNTTCATCATGVGLSSVNGVCVCTSAGTFYSTTTKNCTTCALAVTNCVACTAVSTTTTCTACIPGFFVSSGLCVQCAANCINCSAASCLVCQPTFIASGPNCVCNAGGGLFLGPSNTCVACSILIVGCTTCTSNVSCAVCSLGTFSNGSSCVSCPTLCNGCSSLVSCSGCISNLIVINGTCTCDNTAGSYLNSATNTCYTCSAIIPLCSTCAYNNATATVQCTQCAPGSYNATSTSCLPCMAVCLTCSDGATCDTCVLGYSLVGSTCSCDNCSSCSTAGIPNCANCTTGLTPDVCTLCMPGFFLNSSSECQSCPIGCLTCTDLSTCQSCSFPFIPTASGGCGCNTLALSYYNPSTQTCDTCNNIFLPNGCLSCSEVGYTTSCLACPVGTFLDNNTCVTCTTPCTVCSSASSCTACLPTFSNINGSCVCDNANQIFLYNSSCSSCLTLLTAICTFCSPNSGAPLGVDCTTCVDGFFPDSGTSGCSACPPTCTACSDLSTCLFCKASYTLIGGSCKCDLANQYFLVESTCLPCYAIIAYCLHCDNTTGAVLCTTCVTGTYLTLDQKSCGLCQANCDICNPSNPLQCTQCSIGYVFNGVGGCKCLTTCLNQTLADPFCVDCYQAISATTNLLTLYCSACSARNFVVSYESCNACPTTCNTCSDYTNCLTCWPSYTLQGGSCLCNSYYNEVEISGQCKQCNSVLGGCKVCSVSGATISCLQCLQGWGIQNGACTLCGAGCNGCTISSGTVTCNSFAAAVPCIPNCQTCYSSTTCVQCATSFSYIKGACICDNGLGLFFHATLHTCVACTTLLDVNGLPYLQNCDICRESTVNYPTEGIQCLNCLGGYFVSAGSCVACQNGCLKCTSASECCLCQTPVWIMQAGTCVCDNTLSYFSNGTGCQVCAIANCSVCSNLTTCLSCNIGTFLNSSGQCQVAFCGNAIIQSIEVCDDGNTIDGDGCSSLCVVEPFYYCVAAGLGSSCQVDNRFNIRLLETVNECNKISFKFQIYPFYAYLNNGDYSKFLYMFNLSNYMILSKFERADASFTLEFAYIHTIQELPFNILFDPSTLGLVQTSTYPLNSVQFIIKPTNNVLAVYYQGNVCNKFESLKKLTSVIQYGSYATMFLSILPCKIVGLQLIGVVQLAFMSLGSMDQVNIVLSPMMGASGINGFSFDLGSDPKTARLLQSATPARIDSIGYRANFLRNCNAMLGVVGAVILVATIALTLSYCFRNCAPCLYGLARRTAKQVLLTLLLFNGLNFAYAAGLHFRYALASDTLYVYGTLAAVLVIILPLIMAAALSLTEEDGFGEFKDKLRPGCVERAYFVVTLAYRACLGLYMASSNENELATLIVLAVALLFLLYNLVNLPFVKAYHNYRANICHLSQFICLFVAMYYRSMRSTSAPTEVASVFGPAYLYYSCLVVSLVVSLIVLAYEIYIYIKQCLVKKEEVNKVVSDSNSQLNLEGDQKHQKTVHNVLSIETEGNEHHQPAIIENIYEQNDIYE